MSSLVFANRLEETTWGLGLTSLDDMPDENLYNFGLVSNSFC